MNHFNFVHKTFRASKWESEIKAYIGNLSVPAHSIWYKETIWHKENRILKKASEELITLGYYVKYRYGGADSIEFKLNKRQGKADGWICKDDKPHESVQIVIAYYEKEEADQDALLMSGKKNCFGGWKIDRLNSLSTRIEQRITKKIAKKYSGIDTLIVGVRGWFVRDILNEYPELQKQLASKIEDLLTSSQFKELAIVDTDLVGEGKVWLFPQRAR